MIDRVCSLLKMQKPAMNEGLLWASGTVVPTDATHGYQTGCLFLHTDGGSGTALYVNEGSLTSCDFNPVDAGDLDTVLQVGEFSSLTAGSGIPLSSTQTSAGVVYGDDNGLAITANVYNLRTRLLLTVDQSATSIRALMAQLKLKDGVDVETGIYTANQGYLELAGTHISKAGATLSCMDASLEIGTKLTVNENGEACGLHVETTGAGTITNNGTCAAVLIDKAAGAANWPYGVYVVGSTCHQAFVAGVQGTGVETTTTYPFAVEIHNEANADIVAGDTGLTAGIYNRYEIAVDQTSQCSHVSVAAKLRVKADLADGAHAGVLGYVEISGAGTVIGGAATTTTAAGHFAIESDNNFELSTGHLNGVCIDSSVGATATITGTMSGLRIKKSDGKLAWPTGIAIEDSASATGISVGSTTGHALTFQGTYGDHVIDIQPAVSLGTKKAVYIGTWGTEAQFDDGGGLFRMYGKVGAGGGDSAEIFVRALTDSTSNLSAAQLYADIDSGSPGPKRVRALDCFAMLNDGKYLAASTDNGDGLTAIWAKVGASLGSHCDGDVAVLWIDNAMNCTVHGREFGIYGLVSGSMPDAFIGLERVTHGYSQLIYFDASFNSGAGTCITTDSVPGTQDARIKVYYDGKQYYLPLYR